MACAVLVGAVGLARPAAGSAGPAWKSGVYVGNAAKTALAKFEQERGATAPIVTDYFDQSTWPAMIGDAQWAIPQWAAADQLMSWSVPMLPASGGYTLQAGATGAYNGYFQKLAQLLVANKEGNSVLRIGWEFNGDWEAWSAGSDPAAYVAYYRQIVDTMRAVPGANFTFDWCISNGSTYTDPAAAYPGDDYVDYIGNDVYDWDWGTHDPAKRWHDIVTEKYGLAWQASFAAAHHKPLSFPEWAESWVASGHGGNDDPQFIRDMYAWFSSHKTAYEDYFNDDPSATESHQITDFPKSEAVYDTLFGTTGSAPRTSPPPTKAKSPRTTAHSKTARARARHRSHHARRRHHRKMQRRA
jgi:Glycosyl hydrolase family 26